MRRDFAARVRERRSGGGPSGSHAAERRAAGSHAGGRHDAGSDRIESDVAGNESAGQAEPVRLGSSNRIAGTVPDEARPDGAGSRRPADPASSLHRAAGNQAVQAAATAGDLRTGPAVSEPGDAAEREAERLARSAQRLAGSSTRIGTDAVERSANAGRAAVAEADVDDERDGVAHDADGGRDAVVPGRGQPLAESTRSTFETRFGRDFGDVRVHTGGRADALARSLDATAYTVGSDVVFRQGAHAPETSAGERLLAHELAHVLQQDAAGPGPVQRQEDQAWQVGGDLVGDDEVIGRAIALFAHSDAAGEGAGAEVLSELRSLSASDRIALEEIDGGHSGGLTRESLFDLTPRQSKIAVDSRLRDPDGDDRQDVVRVALTLVQEGVHSASDDLWVEEELAARRVAVSFYEELVEGIEFDERYEVDPADFPDYREMQAAVENDRLVDHVFESSADEEGLCTPRWIRQHLDDWGGLDNRTTLTRATYLRKMMHSWGGQGRPILRILESEVRTEGGLDALLDEAGMTVRGVRSYLREHVDLFHSAEFVRRLRAIEDETDVDLGAPE